MLLLSSKRFLHRSFGSICMCMRRRIPRRWRVLRRFKNHNWLHFNFIEFSEACQLFDVDCSNNIFDIRLNSECNNDQYAHYDGQGSWKIYSDAEKVSYACSRESTDFRVNFTDCGGASIIPMGNAQELRTTLYHVINLGNGFSGSLIDPIPISCTM